MKVKLLGTAAAEGFPAIFCHCEHCIKAKELGGKNIRTRSSAVIDGDLKIDFPPDSYMDVLWKGLSVSTFKHLVFTHTHHDHFHPEDINMRAPIFSHEIDYPLYIYGNETAIEKCENILDQEHFQLKVFKPFQTYVVGNARITPLPADHKPDEESFIYLIEKSGKVCLYGNDTGYFPEETFNWLRDKTIDIAILDCTHGLIDSMKNHMNIEAVKKIKAQFDKNGTFHKDSKVIATHFSHNIGLMHQDLEELLHPYGIDVAYDGMEIKL